MANPEHLAILKQGVEVWNKWREDNPDVKPDLGEVKLLGAKLDGVNLKGADLYRAILYGARLRMADISDADLYWAVLSDADLHNVNFSRTLLSATDLRWAELSEVNFNGAHLGGAKLGGANLNGSSFEGATMIETSLDNIELSQVKGLDTVIHAGPSSIGIDTIYRSGGKIPGSFLRGAGVPAGFIKMIPEILKEKSPYPQCFGSYSSLDQEFVDQLRADLEKEGVDNWLASHDMGIGDKIRDRIDETIRNRDKLLLILSSNSIFSSWVEKEVETAFEEEARRGKTVLFPICLDDEVMTTDKAWAADIRRTRHIGDFTRWKDHDAYKKAFDRLLRDLKASAQG